MPVPEDLRMSRLQGLRRVLDGPLSRADGVVVCAAAAPRGRLRHGIHSHEDWELFCPLAGDLRYEVAGSDPVNLPEGTLLVVAPGCFHTAIDQLPQTPVLRLLLMNLPGTEQGRASLFVGAMGQNDASRRRAFSRAETNALSEGLSASVHETMRLAAEALGGDSWDRERGRGLLRVLVADCARIVAAHKEGSATPGHGKALNALLYLQSHYFEPDLSVNQIARAVGLSPSHLAAVFREAVGDTMHRTLVELRLSRARALLGRQDYSIQEVAALTGWRSQSYFSTAFARRYGAPPSAFRGGAEDSEG